MTRAFWLDGLPTVTLLTEAEPAGRLWNGFHVPQPTVTELVAYLDEVRKVSDPFQYWEIFVGFAEFYGEKVTAVDEPILDVDGFVWQARRIFNAHVSGLSAGLARGHLMRVGHELTGYYVPAEGLPEEWGAERLVRTCCEIPSDGIPEVVVSNTPDKGHEYVGKTFTYLPGIPAMTGERESNLVARPGDQLKVIATFRDWNGVPGLDMLYVENVSSLNDIHNTHVTPGELGLPRLSDGDGWDHFNHRPNYG